MTNSKSEPYILMIFLDFLYQLFVWNIGNFFKTSSPETLSSDERWAFNSIYAVRSEIFGLMPAAPY